MTTPAAVTGPFETEREAADHPAVRAIYDAMHASPGRGVGDEENLALLNRACEAAAVRLGSYDRRILAWLANWEAEVCAVVAGLITRAAGNGQPGGQVPDDLDGAAAGLQELAGLINFRIGAWQDFGYAKPPAPDCKPVPPLGERSVKAIKAGHEAVRDIDQLIAQLRRARAQLVSELRQDQAIGAARVDTMLAERRDGQR